MQSCLYIIRMVSGSGGLGKLLMPVTNKGRQYVGGLMRVIGGGIMAALGAFLGLPLQEDEQKEGKGQPQCQHPSRLLNGYKQEVNMVLIFLESIFR